MEAKIEKLIDLFKQVEESFRCNNIDLYRTNVSERTLCGALMIEFHEALKGTEFEGYNVDIEYNRLVDENTINQKAIVDLKGNRKRVFCDLIVHHRGGGNLIALEMKKHSSRKKSKDADKDRLKFMTKSAKENAEGYCKSEELNCACGYELGIYFEIGKDWDKATIEYFVGGEPYTL